MSNIQIILDIQAKTLEAVARLQAQVNELEQTVRTLQSAYQADYADLNDNQQLLESNMDIITNRRTIDLDDAEMESLNAVVAQVDDLLAEEASMDLVVPQVTNYLNADGEIVSGAEDFEEEVDDGPNNPFSDDPTDFLLTEEEEIIERAYQAFPLKDIVFIGSYLGIKDPNDEPDPITGLTPASIISPIERGTASPPFLVSDKANHPNVEVIV